MATKRGYYREEMLRAIANIEMALTHLSRIIEAFTPQHPEIASQIKELGDALVGIAEILGAIRDRI